MLACDRPRYWCFVKPSVGFLSNDSLTIIRVAASVPREMITIFHLHYSTVFYREFLRKVREKKWKSNQMGQLLNCGKPTVLSHSMPSQWPLGLDFLVRENGFYSLLIRLARTWVSLEIVIRIKYILTISWFYIPRIFFRSRRRRRR